jgi:tetratricopeptide (TPR) repeat protein
VSAVADTRIRWTQSSSVGGLGMGDRQEFERRFREADDNLSALTDEDARAAIEAARNLNADGVLNQDSVNSLAAGTLIDAGVVARDPSAIDEGIARFELLLAAMPERGDLEYCLANGLSAKADLVSENAPGWYLSTAQARRRARRLYQSAGERESTTPSVAAQSFTNLGNSLLRAYRLVEAYDYYARAIELDRSNGVALTGAAKALLLLVQNGVGDRNVLPGVAAKYLMMAREDPQRIRELAGEYGYQQIRPLLEADVPQGDFPDLSCASDYQQFVAENRLSLAPTIEGLDVSLRRWDSFLIGSLVEPITAGPGAPPLFAMFNVLKSEFLVARYLAFAGLRDDLPESGNYTDTLDYADYGVQPAALTLAQRACIDILDKVAVAASEYLGLPGDPKQVSFLNRWFEPRSRSEPPMLQKEIATEISAGNHALIAIAEVSGDIEAGGYLEDKRDLRNSSTHRFTVLHDMGGTPVRKSKYVDHFDSRAFVRQLLETLRLVRAVLLYLAEMITIREHRLLKATPPLPSMTLPDHDWVRGRDL